MVKNTLRPDLKAFIELSNEAWNAAFPAYGYLQNLMKSNPDVSSPNQMYSKRAQ